MRKPDLTYSVSGMFVLILPETPAGERAWEAIARETEGTGKILPEQLAGTLSQLRAAGYTVRKAPKHKPMSAGDLDAALADLDALLA